MGSTKVELVNDLLQKPESDARDRIIARARAGTYHDYDSEEIAPKMLASLELTDAGFHDLAAKVRNGDYDDETPTLEQQEELRKEFGPDFYDSLMGNSPRDKQ